MLKAEKPTSSGIKHVVLDNGWREYELGAVDVRKYRKNKLWTEETIVRCRFQQGIKPIIDKEDNFNLWVDNLYLQVHRVANTKSIPSPTAKTYPPIRALFGHILINLYLHNLTGSRLPISHSREFDGKVECYYRREKFQSGHDQLLALLKGLVAFGLVLPLHGRFLANVDQKILNSSYMQYPLWIDWVCYQLLKQFERALRII